MPIGWSDITFTPDDETIKLVSENWGWLINEPFAPILFSILGDMFFEKQSGGIHWLNTGTGEVTRVANSTEEFQQILGTDVAEDWFLPHLVEALHAEGKIAKAGQCYTFSTLPIFENGKYETWNFNPVTASSHFALTGYMHQQLHNIPEGAKVEFKFE